MAGGPDTAADGGLDAAAAGNGLDAAAGRGLGATTAGGGLDTADLAAATAQLGRSPRGAAGVGWRCPCGRPAVITTAPVLPDGSPFPTLYYLTCPRAVKLCSAMEASGLMAAMNTRLAAESALAAAYQRAHAAYLADRAALAAKLGLDASGLGAVSAGGMPTRVKCLHALAAHALAAGPGANPLGDEVVAGLGAFWRS
ncbi:MAG: DUF501 domain-containing protein, partial [Propionibacteriaceae bacterium]|nr:DUF501 domain-containing protein [Propionibacteriaceae bacterium]